MVNTGAQNQGTRSPKGWTGEPALGPLSRRLQAVTRHLAESDHDRLVQVERQANRVGKGTALVSQGEPYRQTGVLLDGWAVKRRDLADGRRQIVDFVLPGTLIAPQSLLFVVADHSVVTLSEARVALVSRENWAEMVAGSPRLAAALLWVQQCDESVIAERLASLGQRTARERIAHLLVELWLRGRAVDKFTDDYLDVPITQSMLGDALGLSTVHVNRSLQALRRDGLIEQARGGILLRDPDGLRQTCAFEDDYLAADPGAGVLWEHLAPPRPAPPAST